MTDRPTRIYDRIRLQTNTGQIIDHVQLLWPSGERLFVQDISYRGIAFQKPKEFGFAKDHRVKVELEVGDIRPKISLELILKRETDTAVGAEISEIKGDQLQALHQFIESRIPGVLLRRIHEKFYDVSLGMSHWYVAPHGVELVIWEDQEHHIQAFEFRRELESLKYTGSEWNFNSPRSLAILKSEILEILGQVDEDPVEKVLHLLRVNS